MRIRLFLSFLLLPFCVFAQERVQVRGRIVNEKGEAIEYVHVGVPKLGIGVISSVDGRFEIAVPADTLEFHHVSYETGLYAVSKAEDNVLIVLKDSELPPAVFIGGDTKEKYLLRAGTKIPGGGASFDIQDHQEDLGKGEELGSVATARKPFLVKDILFSILFNHIPGCVVAINIYRIEGEPEQFINILHRPIYVNVALTDENKDFDIQPDETILLEPGRYFISFALVDYDMDAFLEYQKKPLSERGLKEMSLLTPLYFKSSYQRSAVLGELKHFPFNIGISIKGLEYQ